MSVIRALSCQCVDHNSQVVWLFEFECCRLSTVLLLGTNKRIVIFIVFINLNYSNFWGRLWNHFHKSQFFKPFLNGNIFAVWEWERGKFNYDHNFSARQEDHLKKKKVSITDLPFRFCKIGLKNTLFIFGRKNGRLFVVVCLFVATLSDCGLLFF